MSKTTSRPGIFSRIFFWNYQRGTWQYDILCALILVFIFLTPKSVFRGSIFYGKDEPRKIEEKKDRGDGSRVESPSLPLLRV